VRAQTLDFELIHGTVVSWIYALIAAFMGPESRVGVPPRDLNDHAAPTPFPAAPTSSVVLSFLHTVLRCVHIPCARA
jgi:hypothetical protein